MAEYRLSQKARADLLAIARYTVQQFGPDQARIYGESFKQCFKSICDNPKLGRGKDEIRLGLRHLTHKSHAIYYIETDQGVLVVRVLHERQDQLTQLV